MYGVSTAIYDFFFFKETDGEPPSKKITPNPINDSKQDEITSDIPILLIGSPSEIQLEEPSVETNAMLNEQSQASVAIPYSSPSTSVFTTVTWDSAFTFTSDSTISAFSKKINLKEVFSTDLIGLALMQKGKVHPLSISDRDKISDIVVTHCMNIEKRLSSEQFSIIAEDLLEIFPGKKKHLLHSTR